MISYKMSGWFVLILIILLGVYYSCKSHEYIKYSSTWEMSRKDRQEYKKKRFCSVPIWFLVLIALAITFTFNDNKYTTYSTFILIALYVVFIFF